jgi:hypothetical protein
VRRSLLVSPWAVSDRPFHDQPPGCLVPELGGTARGPARFVVASLDRLGQAIQETGQ